MRMGSGLAPPAQPVEFHNFFIKIGEESGQASWINTIADLHRYPGGINLSVNFIDFMKSFPV